MKIDIHAHFLAKSFYEAIEAMPGVSERSDPYGRQLVRDGKTIVPLNDAWMAPDHQLRDMDAKGFDVRLLSITTPNLYFFEAGDQAEIAKRVNDETIAFSAAHADRFKTLASLPLGDVEGSLAEIDRVRDAPEVVGLAFGSNVGGVPLSDPRFEPVWARINELRMAVVEHPVHPSFNADLQDLNLSIGIGFYFDTQLMVTRMIMNGVFERFPDFPFVVAHTGAGMLGVINRLDSIAARHPDSKRAMKKSFIAYAQGLYYDTCSFYVPMLMHAREFLGSGRLMFGTDYPFVDADTDYVDSLDMGAEEKKAIIGDTAAGIFGLQ